MTEEQYFQKAGELFEKMATEAKAAENRAYEQNKKALTALIRKAEAAYDKTHRDPMCDAELKADYIADYLIKNNVIALPCAINDTVYKITYNHCCTNPDWDYYSVCETELSLEELDEFGKNLFLSKRDAEKEAERRNKKLHGKEST